MPLTLRPKVLALSNKDLSESSSYDTNCLSVLQPSLYASRSMGNGSEIFHLATHPNAAHGREFALMAGVVAS